MYLCIDRLARDHRALFHVCGAKQEERYPEIFAKTKPFFSTPQNNTPRHKKQTITNQALIRWPEDICRPTCNHQRQLGWCKPTILRLAFPDLERVIFPGTYLGLAGGKGSAAAPNLLVELLKRQEKR